VSSSPEMTTRTPAAMSSPPSPVTDLGWCLTAKEPDMVFSYRWTVEDFKTKMETFKLGQQLESSQFVINGLKLCINLYPNGRNDEEGGYVSLFLRNDNSIQLEVMCEFVLGVKKNFRHHFTFNKINPNSGYGFPKMYSHDQILSKEVLEEGGVLDIKAVITFKGKVRNICHRVDDVEEVVLTDKVGIDLFHSFEQQEFTDFEIVCEDRNIRCHKVVLAARSPVFRAMLLNDMEESSSAKVQPREFNSQTISLLLRFIYRGHLEQDMLDKHAEAIFKAADYYEITNLKQLCEKSLMRKVTIGNMLEMLVLADMYKAPHLRDATKSLIVANSKELLKKRQWKEKLKDSGHLVFEILEAVIKKEEVN